MAEPASTRLERAADESPLARPAVPPEALRDLALAFRTSVEAIEGVRALQEELVVAVKRQDRSELVLRSTEALNETFRNLTNVQREILDRLEEDRRRGPGRVVPLMLIGLLVVFLGGTYAVVSLIRQVREERQDASRVVQLATEGALTAFKDGLEDRDSRHLEEVERLRAENADVRRRAEALIARADAEALEKGELLEAKQGLELELDGLAQQMRRAQNEVMAKRALEEELRATSGHLAVLEPKFRAMEMDLETERDLNARLRKRLAALGYGLPDPEGEEGGPKPPTEKEVVPPETEPAPAPDPRVERDPGLIGKITTRLNQILDTGSASTSSFWQIKSVEGVTEDALVGVELVLLSRQHRRLMQQVQAKSVRFWVDRKQRHAEMVLASGTIQDSRGSKPLPPEGMSFRVARDEMYRLWSQSGLIFVKTRP